MTYVRCHPIDQWDGPRRRHGEHERSPYEARWDRIRSDLEHELEHLGAAEAQIGLDLRREHLRQDGWPRAGVPAPPPVVLTFEAEKLGPMRFQMDRFNSWQHNLRAIGLTLQRLRLVDETGVARSGEQYRGFAALGPGEPVALGSGLTREAAAALLSEHAIESPLSGRSVVPAADLLDPDPDRRRSALRLAYRLGAAVAHPDAPTGDPDLFRRLTEARDLLDPKGAS